MSPVSLYSPRASDVGDCGRISLLAGIPCVTLGYVSTLGAIPIDLHITPIDGRNYFKISTLSDYFSERAINRERVFVEIQYLLWLSRYRVIRPVTTKEQTHLKSLFLLTTKDYLRLREIEQQTNHDVKAVELYLQERLSKTTLRDIASMVHFGLTSDDINSCAYARCINRALKDIILPILWENLAELKKQAREYKQLPMLAYTHGQPANGTTYGKELGVYIYRLEKRIRQLSQFRAAGKCSGNVGNFNAHAVVFPKVDWLRFSETFLEQLEVNPEPISTQIASYDSLTDIFQTMLQINLLLLGLCKDLWLYALLGFLSQKRIPAEVGSTALPHKINPIYLEGAEGGFEIANGLLEMYIRKLSYSRLQRDLSDSTIRRSFGTAFAYSLLSYQSVLESLHRIRPHPEFMAQALDDHYEILSEAIQNYLRAKGRGDAFERTKLFFRGFVHSRQEIAAFIKTLPLATQDKKVLLALTPTGYTGLADRLVETYA